MRPELGDRGDGTFGELEDVVIDPTTKRITHLVVKAHAGAALGRRLVSVELVDPGDRAPSSGHAARPFPRRRTSA
jgi:hypothetical protein